LKGLLATAVCVIASACGPLLAERTIPAEPPRSAGPSDISIEGRLEPIRFAALAPGVDGPVSAVLAKEGDAVQSGQVIARFDSADAHTLEAARATASVELGAAFQAARDAQNELDAYPIPRIFVGMMPQQAAHAWLEELDAAWAQFGPYKDSSRKALKPNRIFPDLPRRIWFDTNEYSRLPKEYKKRLDIAWVNYRKAVDWLALYSALESAKARITQAQKRYDSLQDASSSDVSAGQRAALASAEMRAPFSGTITNLGLKAGERVSAGEPLVTICDLAKWVVKTTNLTEIDVTKIREGQVVKVRLDAVPGTAFEGRVQSIGLNYVERQGDVVYTATILLSDRSPAMRWGMTARIDLGE
jgi:multidrug resistance efflux pump